MAVVIKVLSVLLVGISYCAEAIDMFTAVGQCIMCLQNNQAFCGTTNACDTGSGCGGCNTNPNEDFVPKTGHSINDCANFVFNKWTVVQNCYKANQASCACYIAGGPVVSTVTTTTATTVTTTTSATVTTAVITTARAVTAEWFSDAACLTASGRHGSHKVIFHKVPGSKCVQWEYFRIGEPGSGFKYVQLDGNGNLKMFNMADCTGTAIYTFDPSWLGELRCPLNSCVADQGLYKRMSGIGFDPDSDLSLNCGAAATR